MMEPALTSAEVKGPAVTPAARKPKTGKGKKRGAATPGEAPPAAKKLRTSVTTQDSPVAQQQPPPTPAPPSKRRGGRQAEGKALGEPVAGVGGAGGGGGSGVDAAEPESFVCKGCGDVFPNKSATDRHGRKCPKVLSAKNASAAAQVRARYVNS
jgi:hypothetical protein